MTIFNKLMGELKTSCRFYLLGLVAFTSPSLSAGEYTPPGLYDIEYYQLSNGMRVLLKERHQARSVSYRVIVNVGAADYPCGRKEIPHFLEHLLFNGTSRYTESELDDLVEEHGGSWNAHTNQESTDYELDIFSKYAPLGLEVLYEIMTDSQISPEHVDRSRDIIHREAGGQPSLVESLYWRMGLGRSGSGLAHDRLVKGTTYTCDGVETADDISREDILESYENFYVASNMTLIVVGDFDSAEMKEHIAATFGTIEPGQRNVRELRDPEPVNEKLILSSSMSPLIDSEALVGVAYASGGAHSPDYYPRWFIERYLSDRLFKKLRFDEGLSYSAEIDISSYSNVDVWYAYADTELETMDQVVAMIQEEIDLLVRAPVGEQALELVKSKLLMEIVQGYETNAGMADYYMASLHEIERQGALVREEQEIHALTAADIQRVAGRIFADAPPVVFYNKPTLTYTQLAMILGFAGILFAVLGFRLLVSRRKRQAGQV